MQTCLMLRDPNFGGKAGKLELGKLYLDITDTISLQDSRIDVNLVELK